MKAAICHSDCTVKLSEKPGKETYPGITSPSQGNADEFLECRGSEIGHGICLIISLVVFSVGIMTLIVK